MIYPISFEGLLTVIGERLYAERHNKKEKITCVASNIGVSHPVISQIENGHYKCLSIQLLYRLIEYYKISIEDILIADKLNDNINSKDAIIELLVIENRLLKAKIGSSGNESTTPNIIL